jgi:hypothetical protein
MKAKISILVFLIITVTASFCKKGSSNDTLAIRNLSVSSCKTKGGSSKGIDSEYINLKTVGDYYLLVNHFNSKFGCQPGKITVSMNVSGSEISIDENESTFISNCVCPYDVDFKLGPLQYITYILKFQKGGVTFKEFTINFSKLSDITIDL